MEDSPQVSRSEKCKAVEAGGEIAAVDVHPVRENRLAIEGVAHNQPETLDTLQEQIDALQKQMDALNDRKTRMIAEKVQEYLQALEAVQNQLDTTQNNLKENSWIIARLEREYVQAVEKNSMTPDPRKLPRGTFAKAKGSVLVSIVGEKIGESGFQDELAHFLYFCLALHLEATFALDEMNLGVVYSTLAAERYGGGGWNAPAHDKLAKHLAELGLTMEDWDESFPDQDLVSQKEPLLTKKQKDLLVRLKEFDDKDCADAVDFEWEDDECIEEVGLTC